MSADGSTSGGTAGAQTRHSRFLASVASANLRGDRTDSDGLRRVVVRVALTGHRGSRYDDFGNSDPKAPLSYIEDGLVAFVGQHVAGVGRVEAARVVETIAPSDAHPLEVRADVTLVSRPA